MKGWICVLFLIITINCNPKNSVIHYAIELQNVQKYEGKDAWKNRIKLYINDNHNAYVQPFDYYELSLSVDKFMIEKDSLVGHVSFTLPEGRGIYKIKFNAIVNDNSLKGLYYGHVIANKKELEITGELSGSVSQNKWEPPQLILSGKNLPELPNPDFIKHWNKDSLFNSNGCIYNVLDYGAVGYGQALDMHFIQKAIDACHSNNGGIVLLPSGKYRTGGLQLRSNVVLYLEDQAVLIASHDSIDYKYPYLIFAENVENSGIAGPGTIDARCDYWLDKHRMEYPHRMDGMRLFYYKKDLLFWPTILFKECQDIVFTFFRRDLF